MEFLGLLLYLAPAAFALWCVVRWFRDRGRSFFYRWQRASGLLALCTAPWPLVQAARRMAGSEPSLSNVLEQLAVLPGSWYVLFGGRSVIHLFEENVEAWTGHRRDTMLDHAPVFFGLVLAHVLVLSLLVAWRFQRGKGTRDPLVLAVAVYTTVNAALAMDWPWFGT